MNPWLAVAALAIIAAVIPFGMMAVSWLLRPTVPEQGKQATYESGEIPTGNTRIRFDIQYYMVALLFVVFDIETVLIFPWTVIYRHAVSNPQVGMVTALVPMLVFIGVLVVGLVWAWRNGAVRWVRNPRSMRSEVGR